MSDTLSDTLRESKLLKFFNDSEISNQIRVSIRVFSHFGDSLEG